MLHNFKYANLVNRCRVSSKSLGMQMLYAQWLKRTCWSLSILLMETGPFFTIGLSCLSAEDVEKL